MSLIQRFTSRAGNTIRVRGTDAEPSFCVKDLCSALGIVGHRNKIKLLDEDEKRGYNICTPSGRQRMVFATEPGAYTIILSCNESKIPGTPAHAFRRWVTHDVLPSIRRHGEFVRQRRLEAAVREEKGRRLWIFFRDLDVWSFNARRKHFGKVCRDTKSLCYVDEFRSPHVLVGKLAEAHQVIRETMSAAILASVPKNQRLITNYFTNN